MVFAHCPYVTTFIKGKNRKLKLNGNLAEFAMDTTIPSGSHWEWLQEGVAFDIFHREQIDPEDWEIMMETTEVEGFDIVTQSTAHRRKRVLISDMDSTLIHQECIDELADYAGIKAHVAAITERAMNGELDFKDALRERVALLKGLPESTLQQVYDTRITCMEGAATLVATMKHHADAYCLLVSGGFTFFTSRVATSLGFHEDQSNTLIIADGMLSGQVAEPILDKESKRTSLIACCAERGVTLEESLAVGDGANDLPMLLEAGMGVAYRAKPVVQAQAHACINHNDLSVLLFVQGYKREEWVI